MCYGDAQTGCQVLEPPCAGDGVWAGGQVQRAPGPLSFSALWGGGGPCVDPDQASQAYRISTLPGATHGYPR